MLMMFKKLDCLYILFACMVFSIAFSSCNKEEEADMTDKELFDMAKVTVGSTWYKNSSALLNKSAGSGHSQPFLRTRYDDIASLKLSSNGKIIAGSSFPEGSLIVKELYTDASTLDQYAILYKQTGHKNADAKGWVWGYMKADGTVLYPSSNKGADCNSCHLQADNIDYMLMNKYFP